MINPSSSSPDLPDDQSPAGALPPPAPPPPPPPPPPAASPVAAGPKPPGVAQHARGVVRFFYTQNPFYVISAGLVLWGLRLSLPLLFRMPYYLALVLFFLYPVLLHRHAGVAVDSRLHWWLFSFSPLAGVIFLGLLPAVRRGPRYVRNNGSPWPWPLYPWTLFGVLALGVGMRSYCLCMSFHPGRGPATIFAPYFLVPFLFCVNVLLLEIGVVSHLKRVRQLALAVPVGLAALAITGPGGDRRAGLPRRGHPLLLGGDDDQPGQDRPAAAVACAIVAAHPSRTRRGP